MVLVVKNPPANAGDIRDMDLIAGLGKSPGGEPGNPLQYSCPEDSNAAGADSSIQSADHTLNRKDIAGDLIDR